MKQKFFAAIFLSLVTFIITSCSKDKPADTSSNNVSATILIGNSTPIQFSATGDSVKFHQSLIGTTYQLEAIDKNKNKIFIGFDGLTQTGTYSFTSNDGMIGTGSAFTFIKDLGLTSQLIYWTLDPSYTDRGSATITVFNSHHIEGVFNASCKPEITGENVQVSNGSFKINY